MLTTKRENRLEHSSRRINCNAGMPENVETDKTSLEQYQVFCPLPEMQFHACLLNPIITKRLN